jgi:predicted nucleic acid-binding protein
VSVLRAVVDTNVLVSAGLNPDGAPARVVIAASHGVFAPVVSPAILAEYLEVLSRPRFGFPPDLVERVLAPFRDIAILIDPPLVDLPALPDPDDGPFVAAARFSGCPIVTGNARHFPASAGVAVMGPAEFIEKIGGYR